MEPDGGTEEAELDNFLGQPASSAEDPQDQSAEDPHDQPADKDKVTMRGLLKVLTQTNWWLSSLILFHIFFQHIFFDVFLSILFLVLEVNLSNIPQPILLDFNSLVNEPSQQSLQFEKK